MARPPVRPETDPTRVRGVCGVHGRTLEAGQCVVGLGGSNVRDLARKCATVREIFWGVRGSTRGKTVGARGEGGAEEAGTCGWVERPGAPPFPERKGGGTSMGSGQGW